MLSSQLKDGIEHIILRSITENKALGSIIKHSANMVFLKYAEIYKLCKNKIILEMT